MSKSIRAIIVIASLSLLVSACAKKKSSRPPRSPAPAAAATPAESPAVEGDESAAVIPEQEIKMVDYNEAPDRRMPSEPRRYNEDNYRPIPMPAPAPREEREPRDRRDGNADGPLTEGPIDVDQSSLDPKCGTAFGHSTEMWAPGLPNPPAPQRICTGGVNGRSDVRDNFRCEGTRKSVFTDSRQDGLMAMVVDRINKLPQRMELGSRELARRIRDVKVQTDLNGAGGVRVQIRLLVAEGREETVDLRGSMGRSRRGRGKDIELDCVSSPRGLRFNAVMTCADVDNGCQNSLIRLQQLSRSGKVGRVAYVVHRQGDAHVTISEKDRIGFRNIDNRGHSRFAEYLSNTTYNTCVSILRDAFAGIRQLPACAFQRLKAQCGRRADFKQPAAKSFEFVSWAVAYGRAGFEFQMRDIGKRFGVKGPLVARDEMPVLLEPLTVTGELASSIDQAILVANDGGGNLNLQIDFRGNPKAHTRVSVTTLMEDVRFSAEHLLAQARQMPELAQDQMAGEDESQEEYGLSK